MEPIEVDHEFIIKGGGYEGLTVHGYIQDGILGDQRSKAERPELVVKNITYLTGEKFKGEIEEKSWNFFEDELLSKYN